MCVCVCVCVCRVFVPYELYGLYDYRKVTELYNVMELYVF